MNKPVNHAELQAAIEEVFRDTCAAFAKLDFDAALAHFADEGMVKISQGHVCRGKAELATSWRQRLAGVSELQVRMENVEVHALDDHHAWVTADEYITVNGQERKAIVSNIFELQASGWKILLDHTTYLNTDS